MLFPFTKRGVSNAKIIIVQSLCFLFFLRFLKNCCSIYSYLNDNKLLTPKQSGFRPGVSIINQLLFITYKIYCTFDDTPSKETRAVFLDLSKAFDRVWHEGLIYKLKCNRISDDILALIYNFLSNRKQRVVLNGKTSEWKDVLAGVPQGSVLCPLFFLIYINDLCDNLNSDVRLFADDTSLFLVVENEITGADELNGDLEKVRLWAWQWKMQFNTDKTEEVIFFTKLAKIAHPPFMPGNNVAKRATSEQPSLRQDKALGLYEISQSMSLEAFLI